MNNGVRDKKNTVSHSPASAKYHPFDWIIIGYCLLMVTLLLLLGRPLKSYLDEAAFYTVAGLVSWVIARYLDDSRGGAEAFLRLLYPAVLFTFFYRATGGSMHLVYPGFFDAELAAFEKGLLGVDPSVFFDRHWITTWRNEVLMFCYGSYYVMIPAFVLPVFFRGDYGVIREFMAASTLAFFASYVLFFLYPVAGPRWHFAPEYLHRIEGPVFTSFVHFVMARGAVVGGAMPSSHTGIALVIMLFCLRYYRRTGLLLIPIVSGLAFGAVWGRFHYASDIVVGGAIGAAAVFVTRRFFKSDVPATVSPAPVRESEATHAS